jgi:predicted nucleic acid-binding Zn ribbon protein
VGKLAAIWDDLLPESIADHTSLESFKGGVLTVAVDSSAHRFQLRQLLDGGLLRELQSRFGGPLNKVRLVPGQFTGIPEYRNTVRP